jgi:hypothetical protein
MIRLSIWQNGNKFWFLNGNWHRAIGPAVIWKDDDSEWYCRGQRHRADGPAVLQKTSNSIWFWYDRRVTEFEHMMLAAQEQAYG